MKTSKTGMGALGRKVSSAIALACAAWIATAALAGESAEAQRRARPGRAATAQQAEPAAPAADGTVNINTANEEELTRLPGIGPAKARAILAMRQRVRRFGQVEELMRVQGIGRATLRRLRPMLTLEGPTTLAGRPSGTRRSGAAAPAQASND